MKKSEQVWPTNFNESWTLDRNTQQIKTGIRRARSYFFFSQAVATLDGGQKFFTHWPLVFRLKLVTFMFIFFLHFFLLA